MPPEVDVGAWFKFEKGQEVLNFGFPVEFEQDIVLVAFVHDLNQIGFFQVFLDDAMVAVPLGVE